MQPRLELRNPKIMWRDFDGQGMYSRPGVQTFHVRIDDEELAQQLRADGWDIRIYIPKNDPDAEPITHMKVTMRWDNYPPTVYLVTDKKKTKLDKDTVSQLQNLQFDDVKLLVSQSHWENPRGEGTTAYVRTMYVTPRNEDPFADEYDFSDDILPF